VRIGKLTHLIAIQRDVGTAYDAYGHKVEDWQPLATVWAEVIPQGVAERLLGPQRVAESTDVFRVRWLAGVGPKDRLVADGRTYDITGTQPEGRQRSLLIVAVARSDG
jgi:SPP1 family predicted phage head-tail adaptor